MKRPAVVLAVGLLLLSFAFISYRILWLDYPVFPTAPGKTWQLDMKAHIKGDQEAIRVMIGLPYTNAGGIVVEERITSGKLTFNLLREGPNQVGIWSGDVGPGGEVIEYRATIQKGPHRSSKAKPPKLEPYRASVGKTEQVLAERLVKRWSQLAPPARLRAVAATVTGNWGVPPPDEQDLQAWSAFEQKHGRLEALLLLLRAADLPARPLEGLYLTQNVTTALLVWIEVWTGQDWENLQPETGEVFEKSISFLPLTTGGLPVVRVSHGQLSWVRWTLSEQIISRWRIHFERIIRSERLLDHWSLFRLPAEFQRTFRILLLVPIGALMICILRNLIGFPTFGIFMPVLMALAFRNTGLVYGLGIFGGVVFIGYIVRRSMDKLHLLLVPRLSVLLTLVIASFTVFALVGNKLELRALMAIGLLPFVILTMTIERFFVIVEEAGAREGFRTAAGSAAVAAITHEILHFEPLQLTFFVYPELLFAVAAFQVLLGRYTGYRLSEIIRFRKLRGSA
jgi:hypothetical protein